MLIQNQHNPNINAQSVECVLIGYVQNSKAYRCYNPRMQKIYELYHVRFLEHYDNPTIFAPIEKLVPAAPTMPTTTSKLMLIIRVNETSTDALFNTDDNNNDTVPPLAPLPLPDEQPEAPTDVPAPVIP